MVLVWILAAVVVLLVRNHDSEILKFRLKPLLKFFLLMLGFTAFRVYLIISSGITPYDVEYHWGTSLIPPLGLFMVWWEDVAFVLPTILMMRNNVSRMVYIPYTLLACLLFASAHLYQSVSWAFVTLFYIPVAIHYAIKNGLTTVAACHILFDLISYMTIVLWAWAVVG